MWPLKYLTIIAAVRHQGAASIDYTKMHSNCCCMKSIKTDTIYNKKGVKRVHWIYWLLGTFYISALHHYIGNK